MHVESTKPFRIETAPWYNGRERGIVISVCKYAGDVLRIAIFEHRNSDSICALKWRSPVGMNPPTIQSDGPLAYPTDNKHADIAFSVGPGEIGKMADWVTDQIDEEIRSLNSSCNPPSDPA